MNFQQNEGNIFFLRIFTRFSGEFPLVEILPPDSLVVLANSVDVLQP